MAHRPAFERGYDPAGVSRDAEAAFAAADRTPMLAGPRLPTLVVHGSADPLVDVSHGIATAAAIPDAKLLVMTGSATTFPAVWPQVADAIANTVHRAQPTQD